MANYTIDSFWIPRLGTPSEIGSSSLVGGWSFETEGLDTFKEAPLTHSTEEFGNDADPMQSSIILVSAPGAVGKSTLARQIAFATGSLYVDLATADPVGANTLSGGLVKSELYGAWQSGSLAMLIDGLDEARLRVTQEAFEAFLSDVVDVSANRAAPTVLLGRTGAVQDAWLYLAEACHDDIAVLEIGYYTPEASVEFAEMKLSSSQPNRQHPTVDRKALGLLLNKLRQQTARDGNRFAGYAPVLEAVAKHVAQERNPSALIARIEGGSQPVTLQTVVRPDILDRERGKLTGLQFTDSSLTDKLYSPDEQLARLVARLYHVPPPELPAMHPEDVETYSHALETWVAEHPFLDGSSGTSSAVFDAILSTRALQTSSASVMALQRQLERGVAANPFLYEFCLDQATFIQPEHIGIIYASLRASLSVGDTANLLVVGDEDAVDEETLRAEVELTLTRRDQEKTHVLKFETEQVGTICLGSQVEDVDVVAPHARVEIGPGSEAVLIAPINVQCADLSISTEKVIVESPSEREANAVALQAERFSGAQVSSVPIIQGSVTLSASWPGVDTYPWTSFATERSHPDDPQLDEALRRFRKFVITFRSHKFRGLARVRQKIEHQRMTKGTGQAVLDFMVKERVLSRDGSRYFLDVHRLAELADTTYADCMASRFGAKATAFVRRALEDAAE